MSVAVVARNVEVARGLAARLGIKGAALMSARTLPMACRGRILHSVIVDEGVEVSAEGLDALHLSMRPNGGEVFRLTRASLPPPF